MYLGFASGVKSWSRKMGVLANKKGKFMRVDSSFQPEIKIKHFRNFQN